MTHCEDNAGDRRKGAEYELAFARLLLERGNVLLGVHADVAKGLGLSDVPIIRGWSPGDVAYATKAAERCYAEVKAKYPTHRREYGLEVERLNKLREAKTEGEFDKVLYVIFDTDESVWKWAEVDALVNAGFDVRSGMTYYGGSPKETKIAYWPIGLWRHVCLS